jgi:predicted nucleotidyltransferase
MAGKIANMDVSRPYTAVCPTVDGDVLRVLAGTKLGMTGREVMAMTGRRSHGGVLDALHRLTAHGLVKRVQLNRGYLFALNRDHVAADAVSLLMSLHTELFGRIRGAVANWKVAPVHASVFGSTARGDGDVDSDIDVLIVRPPRVAREESLWQEQVDALREQIEAWTGNHAAVVDKSETELADLGEQQRPIIAELRSDSIVLYGEGLATLLEPS